MSEPNGWNEWSKYVLKELERLSGDIAGVRQLVSEIRMEISMLKVKSGVWGMIGAMIPICITLIMMFIKRVIT